MTRLALRRSPLSYSPFGSTIAREVDEMSDRLRRVFGEGFNMQPLPVDVGWMPPVEVMQGDKAFTVTAELPGLNKEDVNISFEDGMLIIQGEKKETKHETDKETQFHVYERTYGSFNRAFTLPSAVDEAGIKAEFKDGVLKVTLPIAAQSKPRGKMIPIST